MTLPRESSTRRAARPPPSGAARPGAAIAWDVLDALLAWFAVNRRDLPWREPANRADPYRVLVAEVMLQQTQVTTVVPYFRRWLERFPDLQTLAAADEDAVLRSWQGLGYYRRARHLQRAARLSIERFGGALPRGRRELESLPGVGRYTAAAVAALAFATPGVAVDANVRRLASRLHGWPLPPPDAEVERALLARWGEPGPQRAADVAEALIELGALVCTPAAPACRCCPLASDCLAAAEGRPERFPRAAPRRRPPQRRRFALVAVDEGRVWLRRREPGGLLGGLWGFPQADVAPEGGRRFEAVRHAYSHFRLELVPVLVPCDHPALAARGDAGPQPLEALDRLPLSAVDLRVLERLAEQGLVPARASPRSRPP